MYVIIFALSIDIKLQWNRWKLPWKHVHVTEKRVWESWELVLVQSLSPTFQHSPLKPTVFSPPRPAACSPGRCCPAPLSPGPAPPVFACSDPL